MSMLRTTLHHIKKTTTTRPYHSHNTLQSITDAIGQTPLVELTRFLKASTNNNNSLYHNESNFPTKKPPPGRILAKLEYLNPGGSKKDRIAKYIIDSAVSDGRLRPGDHVVELTSGNTGTGLAIVCQSRGLHFHAVMSKGNSPERAIMMRALGARVELVDQAEDSIPGQVSGRDLELVEERCREMVVELGAFRVDQFHDRGSIDAHYYGTGVEIMEQCHGELDLFVDFVGTAGTFVGCSKYFKEKSNGRVKCFVVEPVGAEVLANEAGIDVPEHYLNTTCGHVVQGGGYSKTLSELKLLRDNPDTVDGYIQVSDREVIDTTRLLAQTEGIFGGFSGGANVCAALKLLQIEKYRGSTVCALICDTGLKYMSTDLWNK